MSIVNHSVGADKKVQAVLLRTATDKKGEIIDEIVPYTPNQEEIDVRSMILKHFVLATTTMYMPRVEFNDLSVTGRDQYDQMSFNTYQSNNGEAWEGDQLSAWRSRAIRPVIRNKSMSIAAHATARLIFPKVFAYNEDSDEQKDAATVMEDLMEWSGDVSNYAFTALMRVITALSSPASIGYTEYGEVYRTVKIERGADGKWIEKKVLDEAFPCFMDTVVPVDQLYIENIFEPDIQKQGWLIWRKVYSYTLAQTKYNQFDNFKFVRPGVQTIFDDANRNFYYVYDPNMRQEDVEEIMYWNRNLDLKIILVNGVMMTMPDNANPRADKLYPFDKFGYEPINNKFFYYKSLAFKLQHDADIVNTLYQMVIDKTYLSIFPPMVNTGGEIIASDVIVPGAVTTFSDPNADLRPLNTGSDLKDGYQTLQLVEESIDESSQDPLSQGQNSNGDTTAYEISRIESNANTVLGLFLQMIAKHVRDFGKLRMGDIIQYLTIGEVADITGDAPLAYKTFFLKGGVKGSGKNKKIQFDGSAPDELSEKDYLQSSYDILIQEKKKDMEIYRVNPSLFRELKYQVTVSPDIMNPRSTDLERAYNLETFDRMIQAPNLFDPEETGKLLMESNPTTKNNPDKYVAKQPTMTPPSPQNNKPQMPAANNSPLNTMGAGNPSLSTPSLASIGQQ